MKNNLRVYYVVIPLILGTTIMWAASVPLIKIALDQGVPPITLAAFRFIIASILLLAVLVVRYGWKGTFVHSRSTWRLLFSYAIANLVFPNIVQNIGLLYATAGVGAILLSASPIFTIILGVIFLHESMGIRKALGAVLSTTGVVLLIAGGEPLSGSTSLGNLLLTLAAISWGVADFLGKVALSKIKPIVITGLSFSIGSIILLPIALVTERSSGIVFTMSAYAWYVILTLALFPACLAYIFFFYALARIEVSKLVLFVYLVPVYTVMMSYYVLGEVLGVVPSLLGVMIIVGIALAQLEGITISSSKEEKYIRSLGSLRGKDITRVGGKAANLGELMSIGLPVPMGFCLTAEAFEHLLSATRLHSRISSMLGNVNTNDLNQLGEMARKAQAVICSQEIPQELSKGIVGAYRELCESYKSDELSVAVRSSAIAEDLPEASFAGQLTTYLNVKGDKNVLKAVQKCWAALFTERATIYREKHGFKPTNVDMAVIIQKMIDSEKSGVMFTIHPVTKDHGKIVIEASFGLGQAIVEGSVNPDTYVVDKQTLKVLEKHIACKQRMITKSPGVAGGTIEVDIPAEQQSEPCLTAEEVRKIAKLGQRIEQHYGYPQDIEWAISEGNIYILQTRPVTAL